ncbi:MAG: PaaI family thioesterase [Alphaproteobacteria bacterium]|nr:PaaI family thioesterase [Alphaproteobacteria bacterium]
MFNIQLMAKLTPREFTRITHQTTPIAALFGFRAERLGGGTCTVRVPFRAEFTRDGGTVAGPILMAVADYALYGAVMSVVSNGDKAVTASLNTMFLRRPTPRDVICEARLLRCGKRLAYGEVLLYSEGDAEPVAHVTATYSIPAQAKQPKLPKSLNARK